MDSADRSVPVACTLGPIDGRERMRRWAALGAVDRPTASRDGALLIVSYDAAEGVATELATLAAAEQECCSFLDWSVTEAGGRAILRVRANDHSPDDVAVVADLFRAPQQ